MKKSKKLAAALLSLALCCPVIGAVNAYAAVYDTSIYAASAYGEHEHIASGWITDTLPDYGAAGKQHRECTVCGEVLEEEALPEKTLSAPGNFANTVSTAGGFRMEWSRVSSADGYVIERYVDSEKAWKTAKILSSDTLKFSWGGMPSGTSQQIRIRSYVDTANGRYYSDWVYADAATTPEAPKNFSNTVSTASGFRMEWSKASSADGYVIERYVPGKNTWVKAKTLDKNTLQFSWGGMPSGTSQKIRIRSYIKAGSRYYYSSWVTADACTVPESPKNFSNTVSTDSAFRMEWSRVSSADGYVIERFVPTKNAWVKAKALDKNTLKFSWSGMPSGTPQQVRIRSYVKVGSKYYYSSWVTANACTVPEAPKSFSNTVSTAVGFRMEWDKVGSADGYVIERYVPEKNAWVKAKTLDKNTLKFSWGDLSSGTEHRVRIRSYVKAGSQYFYSPWVNAYAAASPAQVSGFTLTDTDRSDLTFSWSKVANATGYQIWYSSSQNGSYKLLKTISPGSVTEAVVDNLPTGKNYYVKIRAIYKTSNITAYGGFSSPVRARAFNNKSYDSIINSYTNSSYLTAVNTQGYTMSSYAKQRLSNALSGNVSFMMLDLDSGVLVGYKGKNYMGTASTVKMPYMLYCLKQMEDGSPTMDTKLTYRSSDVNYGSGYIKNFRVGTQFTIRQVMQYIFDYSDNIGYYMLQDQFGYSGYNQYIASLGCRTSVNSGSRWGVISAADSTREWIEMYDYIYNGRYADFVRKGFANSVASKFRDGLNNKYTVYSKCGWTEDYNHDTVVVEAEHPYILICLTNRYTNARMYEVARAADYMHDEMWNYFNK